MGCGWSCVQNKRRLHIIYIQLAGDEAYYPIVWPATYADLLKYLKDMFNYAPRRQSLFIDDASGKMVIRDEAGYQSLVPKLKIFHDDVLSVRRYQR